MIDEEKQIDNTADRNDTSEVKRAMTSEATANNEFERRTEVNAQVAAR